MPDPLRKWIAVATAVVGVGLIVQWTLRGTSPGLLPYVICSALPLAYALADGGRVNVRESWAHRFAALAVFLLGSELLGIQLGEHSLSGLLLACVLAAIWATATAALLAHRSVLTELAFAPSVAGPVALIALSAWFGHRHFQLADSAWAPFAIAFVLAVLLASIMIRFGDLQRLEQRPARNDFSVRSRSIWTQLAGFGIPAFVGLIAVLAAVGPALNADTSVQRNAGVTAWQLTVTLAAVTALAFAIVSARPVESNARARSGEPFLDIAPVSAALLLGGLTCFALAPVLALAAPRDLAFGHPLGIGAWLLTTENVYSSPALLQLVRPAGRVKAAAWLCGFAVGANVCWLVSMGLGDQVGPTRTSGAAHATLLVLLGCAAVLVMCGMALWRSMAVEYLTLHPPWQNLLQDALVASVLFLFAAALPAYLAARAPLHSSLLLSATVVGTVIVFLSWLFRNNPKHIKAEQEREVPALNRRRKDDLRNVRSPEKLRIRRLRRHSLLVQNGLYLLVFLGGLAWLAIKVSAVLTVVAGLVLANALALARTRAERRLD